MSDKNLLDRFSRLMKIAPQAVNKTSENSWTENSKESLSTEKKIYAIKLSERGGNKFIGHPITRKEARSGNCLLAVNKLVAKCRWNVPKVILVISIIQLLLHFLSPTGAAYQTLAFSPVHKLDLWRYLTYALLHAGSTHLLINLVLQLVIAFPLETDVGHIKVTLVYVGGILSGSLAASLCTDFSLLVGASSGIYSLLLSYVPHIFMNFSSISHRFLRITFVVGLCLSDVVYTVVHCVVNGNKEPKIHIAAHVFGAASGLLLGLGLYQPQQDRDGNRDLAIAAKITIFKYISLAVYASIVGFVIVMNVIK